MNADAERTFTPALFLSERERDNPSSSLAMTGHWNGPQSLGVTCALRWLFPLPFGRGEGQGEGYGAAVFLETAR